MYLFPKRNLPTLSLESNKFHIKIHRDSPYCQAVSNQLKHFSRLFTGVMGMTTSSKKTTPSHNKLQKCQS